MLYKSRSLSNESLSWFLLLLLSLIWGSSFILIKKGLSGFSALEVGSIRVLSAALFMLPFSANQFRKCSAGELKYLFVVGFSGSFLPALLFSIAETRISSSLSGVLNSMTPVFVLILGALFFRQKIKLFGLLGILCGFLGSFILMAGFSLENLKQFNFYALYVILATICYGINLNVIKFKLKNVRPLDITGISLILVSPFALFTLLAFTSFPSRDLSDVFNPPFLAIIVLGVLGTGVALMLFNKLVKMSSPLFASSVTYLIPIVAVIWGLLDREALLFYHYIGLIFIIAGVLLINRKASK